MWITAKFLCDVQKNFARFVQYTAFSRKYAREIAVSNGRKKMGFCWRQEKAQPVALPQAVLEKSYT